jgi:4,5:9,10-diseco-3-hydroxy-5,9,17-trioxoandrosta-1(10),2-diene-4-oate hydrolase
MEINIPEKHIEVQGLTIRYFEAGNGDPPLLLLHGNGESALDWFWAFPQLAAMHHVYAPDFPGAGQSSKPNRTYSVEFLTQFVLDFAQALNLERLILVGNSLGGLVALRLALSAPEQVAALVLVDSSGLGYAVNPLLSQMTLPVYGEAAIALSKPPLNAKLRVWARTALLFANPQKAPQEWLAVQEQMTQTPGFLEATLSSLRAQVSLFSQHVVVLDDLPRLQMPTLVVWGAQDLVFPKQQAEAAVSRLQKGQLALIPNAGHLPHMEQPDRFAEAVIQFLSTIDDGPA